MMSELSNSIGALEGGRLLTDFSTEKLWSSSGMITGTLWLSIFFGGLFPCPEDGEA